MPTIVSFELPEVFEYACDKTGQKLHIPVKDVPAATHVYAWLKGTQEFFDNFHASETLKKYGCDPKVYGPTTPEHKKAWELRKSAVMPLVNESRDQFMSGTVATRKRTIDPATVRIHEVMTAAGMTTAELTSIDPTEFAKAIKALARKKAA